MPERRDHQDLRIQKPLPDHGVRQCRGLGLAPRGPPPRHDGRLRQVLRRLFHSRHRRPVGERFHLRRQARRAVQPLSGRAHKSSAPTRSGTIVASFGRQYLVELADGTTIACVRRGKRGELACGDRVAIAATAQDQGVIEALEPRASLFYRSDIQREKLIAANVTQIVIVLATAPAFHRELLDRCLVAAEHEKIRALIALNKMDLAASPAALRSLAPYRALGYDVLPLAAKIDIAPLRARLAGHVSVLVGANGRRRKTNTLPPPHS